MVSIENTKYPLGLRRWVVGRIRERRLCVLTRTLNSECNRLRVISSLDIPELGWSQKSGDIFQGYVLMMIPD